MTETLVGQNETLRDLASHNFY